MLQEDLEAARELGESWAERKADVLVGDIPAFEWPDLWRAEWGGELTAHLMRLGEADRRALVDEANRAASERWTELVIEQREREDVEDGELDEEARALRLVEAVRADLPPGLRVGHDGPRAYLQDQRTGEELTVTSLADTWRVVDWWREHPRT